MDYKLNLAGLEKYSSAFAEKACTSFFSSSSLITGNQILKLTPAEQVNFFILQEIFEKWKQEINHLQSPYFDYEHPEVKEALKAFVNKLSNFITVKQADFTPLVQKACYNAIWFSFLPVDFISKNFLNKNFIKKEELKEKTKYIKTHKALYDNFLAVIEQEPKDEIPSTDLYRVLNQVSQQYTANDQSTIASQLSAILSFETDKIFIMPEVQQIAKPVEQPKPVEVKQEQPQEKPITIEASKQEQEPEKQSTLNNQFINKNQSILNDLFKGKTPDPAAVAKGKIASIKGAISINKKYLFVNSLFKGNTE